MFSLIFAVILRIFDYAFVQINIIFTLLSFGGLLRFLFLFYFKLAFAFYFIFLLYIIRDYFYTLRSLYHSLLLVLMNYLNFIIWVVFFIQILFPLNFSLRCALTKRVLKFYHSRLFCDINLRLIGLRTNIWIIWVDSCWWSRLILILNIFFLFFL